MNEVVYSIKEELAFLRAFVREEYCGDRHCYSEKDVIAAEKRLHYKLPAPIREIYLEMADLLMEMELLRPLELLHWQQDYLAFFDSPEAPISGICRQDTPNALYEWAEDDPENMACDYEEEFEECDQDGDKAGKRSVAIRYAAYWDDINARYLEPPLSIKKRQGKFRYQYALDGYCLFLVLDAIQACATDIFPDEEGRCFWASSDLPEQCEPSVDYYANLRQKIEGEFVPLSAQQALLEAEDAFLAYKHLETNTLLICEMWTGMLVLLSAEESLADWIDALQTKLSLTFRQPFAD